MSRAAAVLCSAVLANDERAPAHPTVPSAVDRRIVIDEPPDGGAEIANPDRGFYRALGSDLARATRADVDRAVAGGYRLLYARLDLAAYRNRDLPADLLARFDQGFSAARRGGAKLIVRASYNDPQGETGYRGAKDAPLPRVLRHLAQLKPVWARNSDVIAFVQAGFVGAWGEWHSSSNDLTAPAARTRIRDALLDTAPAGRFVQFRYPPHLMEWMPFPAARHRIGFHNDCLLASSTDVGTFSEEPGRRRSERAYIDRLGDVAPVGGETCNPADDPRAIPRSGCDAILAEGERYNLSYINAGYYRSLFHDRWVAEGCMDTVSRRLGYRVLVRNVAFPEMVARGTRVTLDVTLRNVGWARIYNERSVALLLRNRRNGAVSRILSAGADPRDWLPGVDSAAGIQVALPSDLAIGRYDLLLALPDPDPRLAGDPRYAIRVANADDPASGRGWDAALGAYALGATLIVR